MFLQYIHEKKIKYNFSIDNIYLHNDNFLYLELLVRKSKHNNFKKKIKIYQ